MRISIFAGMLALGATLPAALALPSTEAPLIISGSTTVKPIAKEAAAAFRETHPSVKIVVGSGGSSKGVASVAAGKVSIAMASRALKDKETSAHPNLQAFQIATDGIAIVLHADNPVKELSSDDVKRIFLGQATNWSEFGGNDAPIEPTVHQTHHGTYEFFARYFALEGEAEGKGPKKTVGFRVDKSEGAYGPQFPALDGNQPVLAGLCTSPNGVSWASLGFASGMIENKQPVHMVVLDGVEPSAANVADGSYALQRPLLMVTNGDPSPTAREFLDFMLSPAGQAIVEKQAFLPVATSGQ